MLALVLSITLPPLPNAAVVPADEALRTQAEAAFAEGVRRRDAADQARPHFREAAKCYVAMHDVGARNPALYRNLARAALLADDTPRAVWACHRGLELAPGDARLRDLLSLARERVVYPAPGSFGRPAPGRFPWLWPRGWGWGAIAVAGAAYALAWGALTRRRMTLRSRWTVVALLAGVVGLGAAGWAVAAEVARRYEDSAGVVVITHDGVLLRRGDGLAFPPRYETPLNRGAEARLLTRREDWLQIELGGGEVGWIPAEYALGE